MLLGGAVDQVSLQGLAERRGMQIRLATVDRPGIEGEVVLVTRQRYYTWELSRFCKLDTVQWH